MSPRQTTAMFKGLDHNEISFFSPFSRLMHRNHDKIEIPFGGFFSEFQLFLVTEYKCFLGIVKCIVLVHIKISQQFKNSLTYTSYLTFTLR